MAVRVAARGSLLYLGAVNAGSAVLFGYDKIQAQNGGWRVREADLCKSALLGGWIGGFLAMHMFRHKTQKQSFQQKYVAAVAQNATAGGAALLLASRNNAFRSAFFGDVRRMYRVLSDIFVRSAKRNPHKRGPGSGGYGLSEDVWRNRPK